MRATRIVQKILSNYEGETPGVKANLCRMLMTGKLGGTGKMIILPVDQGFEHGPARSFAPNPAGYDPHYHYQLAIDAGLNAYAAPLGPGSRGRHLRRSDPDHPEGQQRQFADVEHRGQESGDHGLGR
jgi:fructose-bisphosphate aldolase, class I